MTFDDFWWVFTAACSWAMKKDAWSDEGEIIILIDTLQKT